MELDKAIKERHSVRRFRSKKPDWKKIVEAIEAATKIPLAGNIPTLKFILVFDKELINKLAEAASQDFISTAHYVVVVCSDKTMCERSYNEKGEMYSRQQAGAAIENFLLKITDLKLASCWVGAFSDTSVKNILQLPDEIEVDALLPIGYEYEKGAQRHKPTIDTCVYFNIWKNKYMRPIPKPEAK